MTEIEIARAEQRMREAKIPVYGEAWINDGGDWCISINGPQEVVRALRSEPEYRVWKHVELEASK